MRYLFLPLETSNMLNRGQYETQNCNFGTSYYVGQFGLYADKTCRLTKATNLIELSKFKVCSNSSLKMSNVMYIVSNPNFN